jgi:hypothetical protein
MTQAHAVLLEPGHRATESTAMVKVRGWSSAGAAHEVREIAAATAAAAAVRTRIRVRASLLDISFLVGEGCILDPKIMTASVSVSKLSVMYRDRVPGIEPRVFASR